MNTMTECGAFWGGESNNKARAGWSKPILRLGVALALTLAGVASAQSYRVLKSFTGGDGGGPWGTLALSDGVLYGITERGGSWDAGTVFRLNTNGSGFALLRSCSNVNDDANPFAGVVVSGSILYGTTWGTVFKMNTDGTGYLVLHQFSGPDGYGPQCTLLMSGSTLFGTASDGGIIGGTYRRGTIFRLSTDGSGFTLLKVFAGSEGACPVSGLVMSGTTFYGGTSSGGSPGYGVVFGINTDGTGYRLVKEFTGSDGTWPSRSFALSGSILYGTCYYGGSPLHTVQGLGTVFKVNTDGTGFNVLKNFSTGDYSGAYPYGGVVLSGSTLYGTLLQGGDSGNGAVYRLNTDGSHYQLLYHFLGGADGAVPCGSLLFSDGVLYGTTYQGGTFNRGVVFALSLPIPNILTPPASQTVEAGSTAVFRVRPGEDPPLTYQWFFNSSALSGATNSALVLHEVQRPDTGVYTVVLTNDFGSVTSPPAPLSVIAPVERKMVPGLTLMGQPVTSLNLDFTATLGSAPLWTTFDHVLLTAPSQWYFDLRLPMLPQGFYRAWQSGAGAPPALDLQFVPALTLTGAVGTSVRIDYINQFGPVDAWVTNLATVTLTNTSQLYFDTSVIGQPARLYRLIPLP